MSWTPAVLGPPMPPMAPPSAGRHPVLLWALGLMLALATLPMAAGAQELVGWTMLQGGPSHPGDATGLAPAPPLRAAWRSGTADGRAEPLSGVIVVRGAAIAVGLRHVIGVDTSGGAELWRIGRARGPLITPAADPAAGTNGVLVYTEGDGAKSALLGVDLSTRARLWKVALKNPVFSAPTIEGGRVYFGGQDQFLYAADLVSGRVVWKRKLEGEVSTSPAVDGGSVVVASEVPGGGRARLYAIDAATGRVRWSFSQLGGAGVSSASIAQGNTFVGFADHTVRAFDVRTGDQRWSQPVRGGFGPVLAPAVSGPAVYISDADGGLYRFDARTGQRAWVFQFPQVSFGASPLVVGRFVYLGSADGTIGAVDSATGTLVWKASFGAAARYLAPAGDLVLASFVSGQGGLVALRHDPSGHLISQDSPTTLHLPVALANFAAAFAIILLAIMGAFRLLSPDRRGEQDEPSEDGDRLPDEEGEA